MGGGEGGRSVTSILNGEYLILNITYFTIFKQNTYVRTMYKRCFKDVTFDFFQHVNFISVWIHSYGSQYSNTGKSDIIVTSFTKSKQKRTESIILKIKKSDLSSKRGERNSALGARTRVVWAMSTTLSTELLGLSLQNFDA